MFLYKMKFAIVLSVSGKKTTGGNEILNIEFIISTQVSTFEIKPFPRFRPIIYT